MTVEAESHTTEHLVQRRCRNPEHVARILYWNKMDGILDAEFFDETFGERLTTLCINSGLRLEDLVRDPRAVFYGPHREKFASILGKHFERAYYRFELSPMFCDEVFIRLSRRMRDGSDPEWPRRSRPMRLLHIDPDSPGTLPKRQIDETMVNDLTESMMQEGQRQPIRVRLSRDWPFYCLLPYEIVDGLHRFMAARKLGWKAIDVVEDGKSEVDGLPHVAGGATLTDGSLQIGHCSQLEMQFGGFICLLQSTSDDIEGESNGRNKKEGREMNESNRHLLHRDFLMCKVARIRNPWLELQEPDVEDLLDMSWPMKDGNVVESPSGLREREFATDDGIPF